jgi:hypothetical protein
MDATLEPAKKMIDRLLEADATFFKEHHYLDPLLSGPAEHCVRDVYYLCV